MDIPTLVNIVNAYQRARDWAPQWVGTFLRHNIETSRTLTDYATLLTAEAATCNEPERTAQIATAADMRRLAHALRAQAQDVAIIDRARAPWHAHTEPWRLAAARAAAELRRRNLGPHGQPLINTKARKPTRKTCQRNREAVAYSGDITVALAQARIAQQRIAAERTTKPATPEARQPDPVAE